MVARVTARCTGCGACLLTCPEHAFRPIGGRLIVRADRCTDCAECLEICPADAIHLVGQPVVDSPDAPVMEPRRAPPSEPPREEAASEASD